MNRKDGKPIIRKARSTKGQAEIITNETYKMILNGYPRREIIQNHTKRYKISEFQTDEYIDKAHKLIIVEGRVIRKKWLRQKIAQLRDLYQLAVKKKNIKECRNIILAENKVLGYEKLSIKVSEMPEEMPDNIDYDNLTEEEATKMLNEFKTQVNG